MKSGVAEKSVRVIQGIYKSYRRLERCAVGVTKFKAEVGLHHGSALSYLLLLW